MDKIKTLEVNIDDLNNGGVYALIRSVLENKPCDVNIDIATIEGFKDRTNETHFKNLGARIFNISNTTNKIFKQYSVYKNLKKVIEYEQYDNVHIHADTANKLLVSGLAAKKAGAKNIILHSHASDVDGNHRSLKKLLHFICRPLLYTLGAKYVACSDLAAKWMYSKNNYIKINNGIELRRFRFNPEVRKHTREILGIDENIVLIGHVGRFAYQKNHMYILKIAKRLKEKGNKFKILLVGSGELVEEIKRISKEQNLNNIIFYGTSHKVEKLFQAMDIFILPSHFEGLPLVGVEAQAAGLPVIFSDRISKEADLTENCWFIGINDKDLDNWINAIEIALNKNRIDNFKVLLDKQYDINNTVNAICNLYKR